MPPVKSIRHPLGIAGEILNPSKLLPRSVTTPPAPTFCSMGLTHFLPKSRAAAMEHHRLQDTGGHRNRTPPIPFRRVGERISTHRQYACASANRHLPRADSQKFQGGGTTRTNSSENFIARMKAQG
jgi:hypothetical protein